jgi:hypothetical protein
MQDDGFLIEADQRVFGSVFSRIFLQHIFHGGNELGSHSRNAPLLMRPAFEFVFLRSWRIVSGEMPETKPSSTALPASIRNVQWS